jgi:hypothetical protein
VLEALGKDPYVRAEDYVGFLLWCFHPSHPFTKGNKVSKVLYCVDIYYSLQQTLDLSYRL